MWTHIDILQKNMTMTSVQVAYSQENMTTTAVVLNPLRGTWVQIVSAPTQHGQVEMQTFHTLRLLFLLKLI